LYTKEAAYYDAIYSFKDYEREADYLHELIEQHRTRAGGSLLDVACGTGSFIGPLQLYYNIEGVDLSPDMLKVARERYPDVPFHEADMADFELGKRFDVVICMGSAIGYMKTVPRLQQAVASMAKHLQYSGVLVVEPWLLPDAYEVGRMSANFINQPQLKIARMNISQRDGNLSVMDMHHLVTTPAGVEYFIEHHELALFSDDEYRVALEAAGLVVTRDEGIIGRGLYVGRKPEPE
jgi:ubiquinone/menaquinone biosynthesis C-methylase UbiE